MIYKRVDQGRYLQGLPMQDEVDDSTLIDAQKKLLQEAVSIGIYVPLNEPPAARAKKGVSYVKQFVPESGTPTNSTGDEEDGLT